MTPQPAPSSVEFAMAIVVARDFCLGDDPVAWSDDDIDSTARTIAGAGGVDRDAIAYLLVRERDAKRGRRH